jgi:hypothetical protein
MIGQLKIMIKTFWDIYLKLLKWLCDESDEELTDILSSHQQSAQEDQGMSLLPNVEPFHLGRPLVVGRDVNYIGGLDVLSSDPALHPKYACFTSDEESNTNSGTSDDKLSA